ncbi:MAG: flotillin family protein [Acidobacteriota bacterium]
MVTLGIIALVLFGIFVLLGLLVLVARFYKKVEQGKALIVNKMSAEPEVTFTGAVVLPVIHKAEVMDISVKTIEIDRRGLDGLICQDNIRADIKVTFFVRVNKTKEDVIKVAQAIGCQRASDPGTLEVLFNAKFSEALKTVGKQLDFVDLYTKRDEFRDQIIHVIGRDLNGYVLEDAAIDYLEQTPLEKLDRDNILDAQGIRKITELTAIQHVATNDFRRDEEKKIKKQDVEARETILALERQQADAEARQRREIETVKSREEAEILRVAAEELQKSETARLDSQEQVAVREENMKRQVEVAAKNRERVVAIEQERVLKDSSLEAISREREVELQRIAKEKELEKERKAIADVVRERIAVDKTVAEEEEGIKRLRVIEEARRTKEAAVLIAEGAAEEALVKDVKAAEAAEAAAKHKAREMQVLADSELAVADKEAQSKIRLADGTQAAAAAEGLAKVKVKEADAVATEKYGLAEIRVKEADAAALRQVGTAEAEVEREKGLATASALEAKLEAEAKGLREKADAMAALDEVSRQHEEYRLRLETEKDIELRAIEARRQVAEAQAEMLATALSSANIDIVGGESIFVDRLMSSLSSAKSLDAFMDRSETAKLALKDYVDGGRSFAGDVREVLAQSDLGSEDLKNLTLAGLLSRLARGKSGEQAERLGELAKLVNEAGLGNLRARLDD